METGDGWCWGSLTSEGPYSPEKPMSIEGLSGTVLDLVAGGGHTCELNDAGGCSAGVITILGNWAMGRSPGNRSAKFPDRH